MSAHSLPEDSLPEEPLPEGRPRTLLPQRRATALRGVPPSGHTPPHEDAPELWLALCLREDLSEAQLEALAVRAQRFTSRVSLVPPRGLLLEIKGSLHLFGGLEPLLQAVKGELTPAVQAVAPVPRAAWVAAYAGKPLVVTHLALLTGQLAPLPLSALGWPLELLDRLASMGVRSIGQALRLPRAGFARRFGAQALADLEQLTGREPDLRERHRTEAEFRRRRELLYEIEHHGPLVGQLAPLWAELDEFLKTHQLAVLHINCLLWHRQGPPSTCELRLAAPEGDAGRLGSLMEERLRQQQLAQPVRACELEVCEMVPRTAHAESLWQPGEHGGGAAAHCGIELIERLRTRLGAQAVYSLELAASHRPESAWRATVPTLAPKPLRRPPRSPTGLRNATAESCAITRPDSPGCSDCSGGPHWMLSGGTSARRPVWLLRTPLRLPEREGRPWRHGGALRLLVPEPERIETGWWEGAEVRRDYYLAEDPQGVRLWIFREHAAPRGWYLHGVFA